MPFGTPAEQAFARIEAQLGPPQDTGFWDVSGAQDGTYRTYNDTTIVTYASGERGDPSPGPTLELWMTSDTAWVTDRGIRVGSSRAEVEAAYPEATFDLNYSIGGGPSLRLNDSDGRTQMELVLDEATESQVTLIASPIGQFT